MSSAKQIRSPSDIDAASLFIPRRAVRDEDEFFSGRRDYIVKAVSELKVAGTSLALYGERGVGKTSIGWQIYSILRRKSSLPKRWKIRNLENPGSFECFWIECKESMVSIEGVMLSLLLPSDPGGTFADRFPSLFDDERQKEFSKKFKIDLKAIGGELAVTDKRAAGRSRKAAAELEKRQAIRHMFAEALRIIKEESKKDRIAIFIDEVDVLDNRGGLASLIKESNGTSYVAIGIARSQASLIGIEDRREGNQQNGREQHLSAIRKLASLPHIPGLRCGEIGWIFDRAQEETSAKLRFSDAFRKRAIALCRGFPWIAQAIGYSAANACILQATELPVVVDEGHCKFSVDELVSAARDDEPYATLRDLLIGDENARISILEGLSGFADRWVSMDSLKKALPNELGTHFKANINHLVEKLGLLSFSPDKRRVAFCDPIAERLVQLQLEAQEMR